MGEPGSCQYVCKLVDDLMMLCAELYGAVTGAALPDVREQIEESYMPRLREVGVFGDYDA